MGSSTAWVARNMQDLQNRLEQLTPLQRAALAIKELKSKLEQYERSRSEPIAIVGVGCRFPKAPDPAGFWQLLEAGVEARSEVPADRWDVNAIYDADPESPGKVYTRHGYFLDDVDTFDADFFRLTPREAAAMDPQQRLLLEVSWQALEDAGIVPGALAQTRTGVFVGLGSNDYALMNMGDKSQVNPHLGTGNGACFASGRLSYSLGLQGASVTLDTACSSSLVAVHLGCTSLRNGECDLALAAGVQLMLAPDSSVFLCRTRALAPDGRCKTFDASADGYGRGEGCGVVVLKRLRDAERAGDMVYAVIRGSAVNHDGPSGGLTVPNGMAQRKLIRQALENAGVAAHEVDYVEAHGTGTSLGDPIELEALGAELRQGRAPDQPVYVGSVKTNIGHLEAAAGISSLIKVTLALKHARIPRHLHFSEPNRHVAWQELPLRVARELEPWPERPHTRTAGLSSFGLSGTNAHLIVQAVEPPAAPSGPDTGPFVLCLSAPTEAALVALARRWLPALDAGDPVGVLCATAYRSRSQWSHRVAVVAESREALRGELEGFVTGMDSPRILRGECNDKVAPQVAFAFGAQWPALDLPRWQALGRSRAAREALAACATLLEPRWRAALQSLLDTDDVEGLRQLPADLVAFCFMYAEGEVARAWGAVPKVVVGAGVGRLVAGVMAKLVSLSGAVQCITGVAGTSATDAGATDAGLDATTHPDRHPPPVMLANASGAALEKAAFESGAWLAQAAEAAPVQTFGDSLSRLGVARCLGFGVGHPSVACDVMSWSASTTTDPAIQRAELLGRLHVCGVALEWTGFDPDACQVRVRIPTYPFQRSRYLTPQAEAYRVAQGAHSGVPSQLPAVSVPTATTSAEVTAQAATAPVLTPAALSREVYRMVARVLGYEPERPIDARLGFTDLGMDSMMMMDLRAALQTALGRALPATITFDYPCIEALTQHLNGELFPAAAAARVSESARQPSGADPIAIVGMSCRFPGGASSPEAFWQLLRDGRDGILEVPPERWDRDALYDADPDAEGKMYTRHGGFLREPVDGFDAHFFGISPREAQSMDPQQRLLLECVWEALEAAGQPALGLRGTRTGVFVGISSNDYGQRLSQLAEVNPYAGTGNAASVAAGRISYVLGLQGPTLALDTSCSSSLVALHLACQSLREGDAALAVAAGVNLMLAPEATIYFCKLRALARDGRCKTFDASADGYSRGEGCGVLILKRLSDAQKDRDDVLAVIR
ncbi:MAG TPA: beta-ketoacyl synthase N-terminal-like domain-containing protein, partial [Polyangiaceae bacterium]|nr:beta-ketoacyl synthase N-terminal-like domain-containing protein [Polyangiaceae bacterium]